MFDPGQFNQPLQLSVRIFSFILLLKKKKELTFLHLSVVLADREGQGEKGMQPQGRGLEHGHLPAQVSLSGLNLPVAVLVVVEGGLKS